LDHARQLRSRLGLPSLPTENLAVMFDEIRLGGLPENEAILRVG
jgi:hypothetical protein